MQKLRFVIFIVVIVAIIAFAISIFKEKRELFEASPSMKYIPVEQYSSF